MTDEDRPVLVRVTSQQQPVWLSVADAPLVHAESLPHYCPPGSPEAHSYSHFEYQISLDTVISEARIDVWNDVESTHYGPYYSPADLGTHTDEGPWFRLFSDQQYFQDKRLFTVELENWSSNWGRWVQLNLSYRLGRRVPGPEIVASAGPSPDAAVALARQDDDSGRDGR